MKSRDRDVMRRAWRHTGSDAIVEQARGYALLLGFLNVSALYDVRILINPF